MSQGSVGATSRGVDGGRRSSGGSGPGSVSRSTSSSSSSTGRNRARNHHRASSRGQEPATQQRASSPALKKRKFSGDRSVQTTLTFVKVGVTSGLTADGAAASVSNAGKSSVTGSNVDPAAVKRRKSGMGGSPMTAADFAGTVTPGAYPVPGPERVGSSGSGKQKTLRNDVPAAISNLAGKNSACSPSTSSPPPGAAAWQNSVYNTVARPGQAKKLVIKGFKHKPRLPDNYEETVWAKLKNAVHAIQEVRAIPDSLEELYKSCENLCHHKMETRLYAKLQGECQQHAEKICERLKSVRGNKDVYLPAIADAWTTHCQQMIMVRSIFLYLDRTYVLHYSHMQSIWEMGLRLFRNVVVSAPEIKTRTMDGLLDVIEDERDGNAVNKLILKCLIRMYLDLGLYTQEFEPAFLNSTVMYYRSESNRLLGAASAGDIPSYLLHVEKRLAEEEERITNYLDKSTRMALVLATERELLERHVGQMLEKGFDALMDAARVEDMKRLYDLFARVNALEQLKEYCGNYVKKTGTAIVTDKERDSTMVDDLLRFKARLDDFLHLAFHSSETFAHCLKDAFESFINVRQNKPAELIAKFVDARLRSANKTATDEELETLLDRVLVLFRCIQGKDVFEAFYKRDLAKRLLLNKSASFDAEKSMIARLKAECGAGFTSKLEGMFKDMNLSRDIMRSFGESVKYRKNLPSSLELNIYVLTQGYWPTYPPSKVTLPAEMSAYLDAFKAFYFSNHNGRVVQWQHSLGHCVVKAAFPKGNKELLVSLYQTVVLLAFNDVGDRNVPFSAIQSSTGLETGDLQKTLLSLSCGKVRVLLKEPRGREVNTTDTFRLNIGFTHSLFRIKVNTIQMRETPEENTATTESVFQDRKYQVEAAIVRIMKTRKSMTHNALLQEIFNQLRFPVQASDVKKCIESLIDREYLERDKADAAKYKYLA